MAVKQRVQIQLSPKYAEQFALLDVSVKRVISVTQKENA